jgi:putative MATE family efflux protein
MQQKLSPGIRQGLFTDREFYKGFLSIAVPVAIQNFLSSSLNLTNNILVGQLGDASVAAVGLANQVFFILNVILLGIGGGVSVYISQLWGNRNIAPIRKVVSLSLFITMAAAFIFFLPSFIAPGNVLALFSKDRSVIALGSDYLRPVSLSFLLMAPSVCFSSALRSTGNVKLPLFTNIISLLVNTALNYILIFGRLGLPAMGVSGSAIATVVARLTETIILLTAIYTGDRTISIKLDDLLHIPADLVKRFFSTSGELITKDVIWAVGTSIYMIVYARIGTEAVASMNIISTIKNLAYVLFGGVSNACLIMVGNKIGASEEQTAYKYAGRFLKITLILSGILGLLLVLVRPLVLSPYKVSPAVLSSAYSLLLVAAIMMPATSFSSVSIVGVMRSGGDIRYAIVLDLIAVWFIGLPLAWLGGIILQLNIVWVFLMISLQEVFKAFFCFRRYKSRKWINNMVRGI